LVYFNISRKGQLKFNGKRFILYLHPLY
jgi:hypothetical protein